LGGTKSVGWDINLRSWERVCLGVVVTVTDKIVPYRSDWTKILRVSDRRGRAGLLIAEAIHLGIEREGKI